jgi:cation diffusion facilitator CzcD-associated flavoprotein CzcO
MGISEEERNGFVDSDPVAIIIGGGQSGLEVAARLKALDVPSLVLEQNPRIGDNWRNRYETLCLHDPVCEYGTCGW